MHSGAPFNGPSPTGEEFALDEVRLLPPVAPGKFIGLWNNSESPRAKSGLSAPKARLFFLKAPSSIIGNGDRIVRPPAYTRKVLYEAELDLLAEDSSFPQWARAKSCKTFGPVGPYIASGLDWHPLVIKGILNGRGRQSFPASDMIFSPPRAVSALSREMELEPGDLIACGTGIGALPVRDDASIVVSIEGIGALENVFSGEAWKASAS